MQKVTRGFGLIQSIWELCLPGFTKNFISFAAFVSFFPQLVAGPIERASNLLSQITNKRVFSYEQCTAGLKLILWG